MGIMMVEVQNLREMWNKKLSCHGVVLLEESTQAALESCWVHRLDHRQSCCVCGEEIIVGRDLQILQRIQEYLYYNALAPAVKNWQECSVVFSVLSFTCFQQRVLLGLWLTCILDSIGRNKRIVNQNCKTSFWHWSLARRPEVQVDKISVLHGLQLQGEDLRNQLSIQ